MRKLYSIKGNYEHIKDYGDVYFHFSEMIEAINHHFDNDPSKLEQYEKELDQGLTVVIGDYKVKVIKEVL